MTGTCEPPIQAHTRTKIPCVLVCGGLACRAEKEPLDCFRFFPARPVVECGIVNKRRPHAQTWHYCDLNVGNYRTAPLSRPGDDSIDPAEAGQRRRKRLTRQLSASPSGSATSTARTLCLRPIDLPIGDVTAKCWSSEKRVLSTYRWSAFVS